MGAPKARISVVRTSAKAVRDRQIVVSVDGDRFGTLLFDDTITREVDPGPHRIRAHNTLFWKTVHLDLVPGGHARFVRVNRAGFGTYSLLGVLGAGPLYLTFQRNEESA